MPKKRVLYLGRFQPFHKCHLEVVRSLSRGYGGVLGIGCPLDGIIYRNPFSFEERKLMVVSALVEAGRSVRDIVRIDDINDGPRWVAHVRGHADFDLVFTNSEPDIGLFRAAGEVVIGEGKVLFDRARFRGAQIRGLMPSRNTDWEDLVPPAVLKVLRGMGAEERAAKLWRDAGRKCPGCGGKLDRCPGGHELCMGCGWQTDGCDWVDGS